MIDMNEFIDDAKRTESLIPEIHTNVEGLNHIVEGLIHMNGLLDIYKKSIFYGVDISHADITSLAHAAQQSLRGVMNTRITKPSKMDIDPRLLHGIMGVSTESGELLEAINSSEPIDYVNIKEEMFDVLWYLAILADETRVTFDTLTSKGIEKLKIRFPEKFTELAATNRSLDEERQILDTM